jgi:hypothetical protein
VTKTIKGMGIIAAMLSAAALFVACGGSAPGPAPAVPTGPGTSPLVALEMTTSAASVQTKAGETTTVTVTAIDANRNALDKIPITLSADSGIIAASSTSTDSSGRVTATFELGADRGNRDVTIRAASGAISSTATLKVQGTTLALSASPPTATSAATPVELTATVVDASNVPLNNVVVSFATTGGTLSSAVATTDSTGVAKVTLSGIVADATVTATGANASGQTSVKAGSTVLPPPGPTGILIRDISVQVNPSVVAPNGPGSQANFSQLDVRVLGDLDAAVGIPVTNAPVRFRIASSPPFGTLSVDTTMAPVLSNSAGLVSARFIPGEATTGTDQVVICASVDGVATLPGGGAPCNANEKSARLTISQQPLFVRISTNNEIKKVNDNLDYEKAFSIYVTDAAGRGVPGVNVSVRLLPFPDRPLGDPNASDVPPSPNFLRAYRKGYMVYAAGRWVPSPDGVNPGAVVQCNNEDKNFNGILDTGDLDRNNDGKLYPGQSAAFTLTENGVTDSAGFVNLNIRHGQRFYFWATYQIEARAATAGTERLTTMDYTLSAAEADVTAPAGPGFAVSPFGTVQDCQSPN